MMMTVEIRRARDEDAVEGCEVLRRSIAELCVADHKNDPAILGKWLGNKTPHTFRSWIAQPGNSLLVATEDEKILAVGAVTDKGEITLNYVSPGARFRGISKALLAALEGRAAELGCAACRLTSTQTARRFYIANGYVEEEPAGQSRAGAGFPMSKHIAAN